MHHSFVIEGSKCIWFMGDASPMQMKKMAEFPKPDVLIVPYAYANTPSAWEMTKAARATTVVLLHLPEKEKDPFALWRQVKNVTEGECCLWIPEVGETRIV
jgi:L-ascorbate metabolism protein UlaG (beta-lactamase superfamily)